MSKSNDILVSICCLTYNHGQYIRQCLDGFMMQKTTFPFEVLIHDDASTDRTADIIHEYEAKYPDIIKPIYQKENQYSKGVRISPTFQYPRAKGKYIALCEGDDYWIDPYKLQKQVDFLEDHSEYGLVYARAKCFNQKKQKYEGVLGRNYVSFENLLRENTIPTLTVMLRKTLIFQYYNEIDVAKMGWRMGDYPLWLWVAERNKLYFINDVFAVYRVLEESASHSKSLERYIQFYQSCYDIQNFFALRNPSINIKHWIEEYYYVRLYQLCIENGYVVPDFCVNYLERVTPCSFKGRLFKFSCNNKSMKFVLVFCLRNVLLRKIYNYCFG